MNLPYIIALLAAITANCLFAIAWLRLHRRCARQQRQLAGLNRDLDRALRCLNGLGAEDVGQPAGFAESLTEASVMVGLRQGSRPGQPASRATGGATEKYRHAATLAGHGLTSDEIAGVLTISATEAEQLVTLCRCALPVAS